MPNPPSTIEYQPQPEKRGKATLREQMILILLGTAFLALIVGVALTKVASWAHRAPAHTALPSGRGADALFPAPAFALTDQAGSPFAAADLRGKAYICDFIFTTCGQSCPMMTHKLADLQKQTPADLQLVSFTVNPEHDTPAVLKKYAKDYGADTVRWHFLTGTPRQMTETVKGMNLAFKPAANGDPILHSPKFLLVDGAGNVRGVYDSNLPQEMTELVADATWLAGTPGALGK